MKNKLFLPLLLIASFFLAADMQAMNKEKETEKTKSELQEERKSRKRQQREIERTQTVQPSSPPKRPKYSFPSKELKPQVKSLKELGEETVLSYALAKVPKEVGEGILTKQLNFGNTLLHEVTNVNDVERLIKEEAHLYAQNYDKQTVFNYYIATGKLDLAHYLLDNSSRFGISSLMFITKDIFNSTPLMNSIKQGDEKLALKIIDKIQKENRDSLHEYINEQNNAGQTALSLATMNLPQFVGLLLQHGANANVVVGSNNLIILAIKSHNENLIPTLVAAGADVNFQNNNFTPLILAVENNNFIALKILIDAGANTNLNLNNTTYKALDAAIGNDNVDAAKFLIEYGKARIVDSDGYTSLMNAARHGALNTTKYLAENHNQLHMKDNDGKTALTYALEGIEARGIDDVKILEYLLTKGIEIQQIDLNTAKALDAEEDVNTLELLEKTLANRQEKELAEQLQQEWLEDVKKRESSSEEEEEEGD